MIIMPSTINNYNGSTERCDIVEGPCSCGAWHKLSEWSKEVIEETNKQTTQSRRS